MSLYYALKFFPSSRDIWLNFSRGSIKNFSIFFHSIIWYKSLNFTSPFFCKFFFRRPSKSTPVMVINVHRYDSRNTQLTRPPLFPYPEKYDNLKTLNTHLVQGTFYPGVRILELIRQKIPLSVFFFILSPSHSVWCSTSDSAQCCNTL